MKRILLEIVMKFLLTDSGELRTWARILPWLLMSCIAVLTVAYAYNLIK